MKPSDIEMRYELEGWELFWALLALEPVDPSGEALETVRSEVAAEARHRLELSTLAQHPPVAALRSLFRAAGCDPTRYRLVAYLPAGVVTIGAARRELARLLAAAPVAVHLEPARMEI